MTDSRPSYEYLIVYQLGKVIQDLNIEFCQHFITSFRQREQMEQAGRSNPQNVAEGSTGESLSSYIQLSGIARGSNEELGIDYEDFLRQKGLPIWEKDHPKVREFRKFRVFWTGPNSLNTPNLPNDPTEAANLILTLCQMEGFLLKKHIDALEEKHRTEGGFKENLFKKRQDFKKKQ